MCTPRISGMAGIRRRVTRSVEVRGGHRRSPAPRLSVRTVSSTPAHRPDHRGDADMTFGSQFSGLGDPIGGGMPLYRFVGNRLTTILENVMLGSRFTELRSGLRASTRRCLLSLPLLSYSDDFVFDSQFLITRWPVPGSASCAPPRLCSHLASLRTRSFGRIVKASFPGMHSRPPVAKRRGLPRESSNTRQRVRRIGRNCSQRSFDHGLRSLVRQSG
jgi:hypothetical protein